MTVEPMFERLLATRLREALEAESGPHSAWADSPAARRVVERQRDRRLTSRRNLRLLAIAAIVVIGGAAAAVGAALLLNRQLSTHQVTNGWVAYEAGGDIYVIRDGSEPHRVVGSEGDGVDETCPRFSHDGRRLAYTTGPTSELPGAFWTLVTTELDSDGFPVGESRRTGFSAGSAAEGRCFGWSPSGEFFAFVPSWGPAVESPLQLATEDGDLRLVFDGRGQIDADAHLGEFAWSPDSGRIAIASEVRRGTDYVKSQIWIVDVASRSARLLVDGPVNEAVSEMAFSPDGSQLAYRGVLARLETVEGVQYASPFGEFVRRIEIDAPSATSIEIDSWSDAPGFDKDGAPIGFSSAGGPAWSVDGDRVAYLREGTVVVAQVNGDDRLVLPAATLDGVAVTPMSALVWSPDGKRLLFIGADRTFIDRGTRYALFSVDASGAGPPIALIPWTEPRGDTASLPITPNLSWQGVQR